MIRARLTQNRQEQLRLLREEELQLQEALQSVGNKRPRCPEYVEEEIQAERALLAMRNYPSSLPDASTVETDSTSQPPAKRHKTT